MCVNGFVPIVLSRFLFLILAAVALLQPAPEASAQSAPDFALKVTRSFSGPGGTSNTTEWLSSADGIFTFPIDVAQQGITGQSFSESSQTVGFVLYIRSQPDFFPSGGTVRQERVLIGQIEASKPFGENFSARATAPFHYPFLGNECQSFNGPTHWTACARNEPPKYESNDVNYFDQFSSNAGVPQLNIVPGFPAVPYRQVSGGPAFDPEVTFYCNPNTGIHTCAIPDVSASVSLTGTLAVSINPPTYTLQPGNMPGHYEKFQCPSAPAGSGAGSGFGGDDEGSEPISLLLNTSTGNALARIPDPVRTRGFPLRNRIFVNSQVVETSRPMGNATFTYDIHVFSPSMVGQSRWLLVDGDGKRLDYGTGVSPIGAPGNYATLIETPEGFTVTNASAPEDLRSAGNYHIRLTQRGNFSRLLTLKATCRRLPIIQGS